MNHDFLAVFDIDGTLTDSVPQHQTAFEAAMRDFSFPALRTDWASYRQHTDSAIFAEAWEDAAMEGEPDIARLENRFAAAFDAVTLTSPVSEIQGASAFLAHLEDAGIPVAFATGSLRYGAARKLSVLAPEIDPDLVATASEHQTRESLVSRAIENARKRYALSADTRVVSLGDGAWDLKTARGLGLDFVGIGGGANAETLRAEGAQVFTDFTNPQDILTALSR